MSFSLKTIALAFIWMSFVLAIFVTARADAADGKAYSSHLASEVLMLANFVFAVAVIAVGVGSFPDRFWLAASIVAIVLVLTQMYDLLPTRAFQTLIGENILPSMATPPASGDRFWLAEHSSEITDLLFYSWNPLISLSCGRLAAWKSKHRPHNYCRI